ncbi:VWA domain-containing protein [Polaribacter pacificus]|uniref:VWA domain-containing protein n=1 Tax=Polaribacter pacificus TaxID=1775173 RepID=UPI00166BE83F|nr:VWA domain-containing protein [Polaribacter pacificus]
MQTTTILLILFAVLISLGASWFLYFYKNPKVKRTHLLLFSLRFLAFFLLILLWINPSIENDRITSKKPSLTILADNSLSIKFLKQDRGLLNALEKLRQNQSLSDKFELMWYRFGNELAVMPTDSLSFKDTQTNIYKALESVDKLTKNSSDPVLLLTDGNQTLGTSYNYSGTKNNIYPIILGDTVPKTDISIKQINANPYSYLSNTFPVEIRFLYQGETAVNTTFYLKVGNRMLFKKNLSFSKTSTSQTITTYLDADKIGVHYYTASIAPIKNEENLKNNLKTFAVEVFNEQTNIAIISETQHPDIGALKRAIETNKQRKVTLLNLENNHLKNSDFQLVILYQPNQNFQSVFTEIQQQELNYWVVTGLQTDWDFLNEAQKNYQKKSINSIEEYGAYYNKSFTAFAQEDIGFTNFPPLQDQFGGIKINNKQDAILYQSITGFDTETPLLTTFEEANQKSAVLLGEGLWKWRATSFRVANSFQDFDAFIGNTVQYLASSQQRERLSIKVENTYPANSPIKISAFYVDKNYKFDPRAKLQLKLVNTTNNNQINSSFYLEDNSFELIVNNLAPGDYQYTVQVENQTLKKSGSFKITDFQIEEQFTMANIEGLKSLAKRTEGQWYSSNNILEAINAIVKDNRYQTVQKSTKVQEELIHWPILLVMIILLFSAEWFIRKYYGHI